jgi:hypothetical protein
VISGWPFSCDSSAPDKAVRASAMEQLKKNRFDFCYSRIFSKDFLQSRCQDRSAWRKNPTNKGDTRLLPKRRQNHGVGGTVTTNHLLLPRRLGKAAFSLPISQPNSDFLETRPQQETRGGRGVSPIHPSKTLYR